MLLLLTVFRLLVPGFLRPDNLLDMMDQISINAILAMGIMLTILVGGIDGTFKGNRHLVFPDNTQRTSNLLLSILHRFGIEQDRIGTSTGPLAGIEPLPLA